MRDAPLLPPPGARPMPAAASPASSIVAPKPTVPVRRKFSPAQHAVNRDLPAKIVREATAAEEAAFATLEHEVGGRALLAANLAGADLSLDEAKVVGMMADPDNDRLSLAKICAFGGLALSRLLKILEQVVMVKGQLKARAKIAQHLPDVAAGVMEDAIRGDRICSVCQGLSVIPTPTAEDPNATGPCRTCFGRGVVPYLPPTDVRKLALDIGGLTPKASGARVVNINANNQGSGIGGSESFDQLMAKLDGALYGGGRERVRVAVAPVPPVQQDGDQGKDQQS